MLSVGTTANAALNTKLYDKRDYSNFLIVNISFIWRNIPTAHGYGVYIS